MKIETLVRTSYLGADRRVFETEDEAVRSFVVAALADFLSEKGGSHYDFDARYAAEELLRALPDEAIGPLRRALGVDASSDPT